MRTRNKRPAGEYPQPGQIRFADRAAPTPTDEAATEDKAPVEDTADGSGDDSDKPEATE